MLTRKLSGLYLTKFAGRFSREQLAGGDLVFERETLLAADAVDALVRDLGGNDMDRMRAAKRMLVAAGAGNVPRIAKHLAAADSQLRITLAQTLSMIGELDAVPAIIDAHEKEEDKLARMALDQALTELTGHAEGKWRAWWERNKP